ncbi:MAG: hypothetical protein PHF00_06190 [Elusimicrobia bacterium]|nr:hypothetical protein [Elusimicrobiota bacterium]
MEALAASLRRDALAHRPESAVEIEVATTGSLLRQLTTPGGTVAGLLGELPAPKWLEGPREQEWDDLDPYVQLRLLRYATAKRRISFSKDRRLHGVAVKKMLDMDFSKPTIFLGKSFAAGRHAVDVSRAMSGPVEHSGPANQAAVMGLELHFRSAQSAGANSRDAWTLSKSLGLGLDHQHVHVVAPLPLEKLHAEPEFQAALMGDFFRRLNLLAETLGVLHGDALFTRAGLRLVYFAFANSAKLEAVMEYLRGVGLGIKGRWNRQLEAVSFRGTDRYNQPGLYGAEYRLLREHYGEAAMSGILDDMQRGMLLGEYGIAEERFARWLEGRNSFQAVAYAYYNQIRTSIFGTYPALWSHAHPEIKKRAGWLLRLRLRILALRHAEVKMLVHDWSSDPLFYADSRKQEKILSEQLRALDRIRKGQPVGAVMKDFVARSGLYRALRISLRRIGVSGDVSDARVGGVAPSS